MEEGEEENYEYDNERIEEESENEGSESDISKPKCELLNKKTDNLLLKLKLANNLINWEANM